MLVSAVRSTVRCVPEVKLDRDGKLSDITLKTKSFFSKKVDLRGEKRVIINLADVRLDDGRIFSNIRRKGEMQKIPILLEWLGFDNESQEKIYEQFGDGNFEVGVDRFVNHFVKKGLVTVERIGYSGKDANDPKFYLIINKLRDEGANSAFYKGFSRKGTPRAIHKKIEESVKPFQLLHLFSA